VKTQFGPFVFDRTVQLLAREGQEVPLPPRVLGVLDVLAGRPGQIVSKQELIETVWKDAFVSDTSLAEAISFLRQALGDDPQQPSYIQTVHRRGYRFLPTAVDAPPAPAPAVGSPARDVWLGVVPWAVAVILAAVAASVLWRLAHPDALVVLPLARFQVDLPAGAALDESAPAVAMSADGSRIAFTACGADGCQIFVRDLGETTARAVQGTQGGSQPFLSPDGALLGFFADGKLKKTAVSKAAVSGDTPTVVADVRQPLGAVWLDDGSIVSAAAPTGGLGGLSRVSADGGAPSTMLDVDAPAGELALAWPDALPGGGILATALMGPGEAAPTRIVAFSLPARERKTVMERAAFARFVPPSTIVFVQDGGLMAAAFDVSQLKIVSQPVAVGPRVSASAPQFAVSRVGSVVVVPAPAGGSEPLAWRSRDGSLAPVPTPFRLASPSLSRDGRLVTALTRDEARADVWSIDVERGALSRLTFEGDHRSPIWSADGLTVVFSSRAHGPFNLFARPVDAAASHRITSASHHQVPGSISPDGRVAYTEFDPVTGEDIWTVPIAGGQSSPFVRTPFDESSPAFSPDGRWLAYQSNESNRWEIYARPSSGAGAAVSISAGGGTSPVWSHDGRTIFYSGPTGVAAVAVAGCGTSERCDLLPSRPTLIVRGAWMPRGEAPDGRVLVEAIRDRGAPATSMIVTLQWTRELQRLVPPAVVSSPK
jgi:DNA-binding winged helix-turn-helix (wHTH) protein/Tol biopolymer transport system component